MAVKERTITVDALKASCERHPGSDPVEGMRWRLRAGWARTPLPWESIAGIAAAVAAQHARPVGLPAWSRPSGWTVGCAGLGMVTAAMWERGPGSLEEPATLVTRGLHARSRNPMYVGFIMVHAGLAGTTRNAWMLASCPVSAALLHHSILREERSLRERFGVAYDAYTADVPRYW